MLEPLSELVTVISILKLVICRLGKRDQTRDGLIAKHAALPEKWTWECFS